MLLHSLLMHAELHEELQRVSLTQISSFLSVCTRLRRHIDILQPANSSVTDAAPAMLPPSITGFLANYLGAPVVTIGLLWDVLKDLAWAEPTEDERFKEDACLFEHHGHPIGLSKSIRLLCNMFINPCLYY